MKFNTLAKIFFVALPMVAFGQQSSSNVNSIFFGANPIPFDPVDELLWITAHSNFIVGSEEDVFLERHEHDPDEDAYLQTAEFSLNINPFDFLEGFVNLAVFQDTEGDLGAESEESFLKLVNIPYGFEVRGGRFLNRIGTQNQIHLHGWDYVDANLSTFFLFGEEGVSTDGVEVSWGTEFEKGGIFISSAFGEAVGHHEEEDEDKDEDEDEDGEEEEHGHEEEEEEEAGFEGNVFTTRGIFYYNLTDFHQNTLGLNYATSTESGVENSVFGVDYTYKWRENGFEPGGKSFSILGEYFLLDNEEETFNSFLISGLYQFNPVWSLGARYEFIEFGGETFDEQFVTEDRQRATVALTYTKPFYENWFTTARLQYNQDWQSTGEERSGGWFQLGLHYGGQEIR